MVYTPETPMARLVADNYLMLQVMSRFGIKVGFGDDTVAQVCRRYNVDSATFLAVADFMVEGYRDIRPPEDAATLRRHVASMLLYLKQSHAYFLDYFLPSIRGKLLAGIRMSDADVSFLLLRFFDDYMAEVRAHMEYEETTVFPHIELLLKGDADARYEVDTYSAHHHEVSSRLVELKRIILRYCPSDADVNLLNDALYDIFRCEQELESHCELEDHILVPAISLLEQKVRAAAENSSGDGQK